MFFQDLIDILQKMEISNKAQDFQNSQDISKVFVTEKTIKQITLDPYLETADTDTSNNCYPKKQEISRFDFFKGEKNPRYMPEGENQCNVQNEQEKRGNKY